MGETLWEGVKWLAGIIIGVGGLYAGFVALRVLGRAIMGDELAVELENIDCVFIHGNKTRPKEITGLHLVAFLTNSGKTKAYVAVDRVESNVGRARSEPDAVSWPVLPIGPKIRLKLDADNVAVKISKGQHVPGRIDWQLKIGSKEDKLTKPFRIKGKIAVDTSGKKPLMLWEPDDDSEHPIGMTAGRIERDPHGNELKRAARAYPGNVGP